MWIPVESCRLPTQEQPLRADEFDDLFREHLVSVTAESPTRTELVLRAHAGASSADTTLLLSEMCTDLLSEMWTGAGRRGSDGADLAARVRDLVARESACCSFFGFDVTESGDGAVRLAISVPEERVDVLSALTSRADSLAR